MLLFPFFKLIRWQNLIMLAFIQFTLKYVFFKNYQITTALTNSEFILLTLSVIFIAAGGNIINDIFDIETDKINKPNKLLIGPYFSLRQAKLLYTIITLIGICCGIYLSFKTENHLLSISFVLIALSLYFYSAYLKRKAIIGNLLISFLIGFSMLLLGLFDIFPFLKDGASNQNLVFTILLIYAFFASTLNFIREIIKDIEDVDGDFTTKMKTLPILIGRERTQKIVFFISLIFTLSLLYLLVVNRFISTYIFGYGLFLIVIPLLYFCFQLYKASSKRDFKQLSLLLKLIMFLGICSLFIL